MLPATLLREYFTSERFDRVPESDLIMDSEEAVSAFARAGQPNGILSGVYAFFVENACRMIRPGDRVLDLGCGPGLLLQSIAALNPDSTFVGVDYSDTMIGRCNESLRARGLHNVRFHIDDMTNLPSLPARSVDVVLSSMAMHHLPDTSALHACFHAIERVMAPDGRIFVADFGRLRSLKSIEYFVRRAIPPGEPRLEQDYRASLRAAFSTEEFIQAFSAPMKQRFSLYSTAVTPMMIVVMTPFPESPRGGKRISSPVVRPGPSCRRADYRQLKLSFRLGGMPTK